jgi:D-alanyl-D-alanine carboxypeptidase (penicillin-binding protein 5/6)
VNRAHVGGAEQLIERENLPAQREREPALAGILVARPRRDGSLGALLFMTNLRGHPATVILLLGVILASAGAKTVPPAYLGAIITEADTGRVLFEDNADAITPPASMTKLMTFAVLHDRLANGTLTLATPVTVTAADADIGGTQVWLKDKETFTIEELIYAMMIQSANDAAQALGRTVAGSPAAFVELMNAKARALGLTHTTFRTAHGLPPVGRRIADGDLSTPRDYALLSRYLLLETDVTKYTGVRQRKFGEGRRTPDRVIDMNNHNNLLGKVAGVDGLKTGYTKGAGYCLAATAERNDRRLIVVVMGSPDSKTRDLKTIELIERGFATQLATAPVVKSAATGDTPPAQAPEAPTIKPDKAPAAATEQSSTAKEPALIFRVIPPQKKP